MGDFVSDEFQSSAPIKYCAALIEDALAAAPKNGALYLARAKLRFLAGDVEGAKRDWLNASQTEVWSKGERHLKTHVGRLYREAGLPTVEAAGEAATRNFFIADSFEKPLRKLLVDAVNANDDRAQRETGELMRLLYRSLRLKIHGEWRNYSEPFMDVALIGAIANKDPDNQLDTDAITLRKGPEHYEKAKLVVRDYLETHMGKNLHTGVVEEFENLQKEMERLSKMQDERFFRSIA
ncbi:MAG: hypothetical protein HY897_10785 [Deltaproteobacteria bacterium]|nr:hypothetical protein [Deltaproteobacteria bacterium]